MGGVVGVIQARMGSTRLPGKILAPILDRPLLAHVVGRLASAPVDVWWLATTEARADDVTAAWGEQLGLRVWRGPDEDVLERFLGVTRQAQPEWLVRVTADQPFVDGAIVGRLLAAAQAMPAGHDVISDDPEQPWSPRGYGPQVARGHVLEEVAASIPSDQPFHRAHVLSWLYAQGRAAFLPAPSGWPPRPAWRWTIDTPADLAMTRAAFAELADRWERVDYLQLVEHLDARPQVAALNQAVEQKPVEEG